MPTFYCNNEKCDLYKDEKFYSKVSYSMKDGSLSPNINSCVRCGNPLTEVKVKGGGYPSMRKWNLKSSKEKREALKKESSEHFKKHIQPNIIDMNRAGKNTMGE
jgi:hypothetical protein